MQLNIRVILIVVIVMIVVIFLALMVYKPTPEHNKRYEVSAHSHDNDGKITVNEIITVDFDEKTQKFTVNGMQNPKLNIKGDNYYEFQNVSDHPLYFGHSSKGSKTMKDAIALYKGEPKSLRGGSIFFNADHNAPSEFYYSSPEVKISGISISVIFTKEKDSTV